MNRDKVLKLLKLSASSNDNEALSAIRMVHRNIQDWDKFLNNSNSLDSLQRARYENEISALKKSVARHSTLYQQAYSSFQRADYLYKNYYEENDALKNRIVNLEQEKKILKSKFRVPYGYFAVFLIVGLIIGLSL